MLAQGEWLWLKLIHVHPGQRTSLQYHNHRAEFHLRLNDVRWARYKVRRQHRMTPGWYLELAWGHPHEADNVRLSDDYGRRE